MTSSILGPAPILDFDGTIAPLPLDWAALRAQLGVARIDDVWALDDSAAWDVVRRAEEAAAAVASPNRRLLAAMDGVVAFAVLTNNAESAVRCFLHRHQVLARRVAMIVGRETLQGPKRSFPVFERGFRRCVDATGDGRGACPVVYVGDSPFELDYASRLGARAIGVEVLG